MCMYLLVSCQYLQVSAGIMSVYAFMCSYYKKIIQNCLSTKCRYVHVSACILHVPCRYVLECDAMHTDICYDSVLCTLTFVMTVSIPRPYGVCCPVSHIVGKLPLIPAWDHCTIPRSMHGRKDACYKLGVCDRQGEPGSGSPLFYINTWAMVWPNDYPALAT